MDSSPPDRAQLRNFFGFTHERTLRTAEAVTHGQPSVPEDSTGKPIMHRRQQMNPWARLPEWQLPAGTAKLEPSADSESSTDDENFLGGDFSLSELLKDLPSDRIETGSIDLQDLPPLSAACLLPVSEFARTGQTRADKVRQLLAEGADPRECDPVYGRSPLHWACFQSEVSVIRMICNALQASASPAQQQARTGLARDINLPDMNGLTPLQAVLNLRIASGHADIVECLIEYEADLSGLPKRGAELLFADFVTVKIAQSAVHSGVAIDVRNHINCTPLLKAALAGNLPVVSFLLQQGADPNQRIFFGGGALNHSGLSTEVAALLIAHGANVNLSDDLGMTPLMFACQDGNRPLMQLLLRHGASVNAVSVDRMRVLDYAPDPDTAHFLETAAGLAPPTRLADH